MSMIVRPWAELHSTLPDDSIEDEEGGDYFRQGGVTLTKIIAGMLRGYGCEAGAPIYAGDNGWELDATLGKIKLWVQVTAMDDYTIILKQNGKNRGAYGDWYPEYLDILKRFAADLAADARFSDIRWFTQEELNTKGAPGAASPVTGSPPPQPDRPPSFFQRLWASARRMES